MTGVRDLGRLLSKPGCGKLREAMKRSLVILALSVVTLPMFGEATGRYLVMTRPAARLVIGKDGVLVAHFAIAKNSIIEQTGRGATEAAQAV